ncbi:MAG: cadmium-translocating P-type ATPase [Spirochaetes bacterium GWF1_31_7]|nr:MAG: cadmium-translocating P-type ATPase [Spirochaetes bacterium GWE1_32_154]OHD51300.1 MAG: cadmium-translocating P-type ATPase [Spirochaetes bacterium GWE2_31_10]OHD51497.1 MAG: cadmium-translocating P-type ATPase [Spirochaetes bacterium GWF1_31_7]OHD83315.1 MAG: cadmium-translocating P-type ATPase [Spirochaetes bacterium RIFOXYB1_FULL_32_8]
MENKTELLLEGLSCPNCFAKIEDEIKKLSDVKGVSINFMEKTLSIELNEISRADAVLKEAYQIINHIEPDIIIKDKKLSKHEQKIFIATGLCCESCCVKVEKELRQIDGVKSAMLDYATGKLLLEFMPHANSDRIIKEVRGTAKTIIEKIKIKDEEITVKRQALIYYIQIGIGVLLYAVALFIPLKPEIRFVIFVLSFLCIGIHVLIAAIKNIVRGNFFDENFLMTIATIGAFVLHEYPEAVAVMLFYQIGEMLQEGAISHSRSSIKSLLNIRPEYANIMQGSDLVKISPYEVNVGDVIVVKPGEKIPVDGIVEKGAGFIDTRALTGESVPQSIRPGEEVLSGSIVTNTVLSVKATKTFSNSTVSKIMELIETSTSKKSKTENFITKFAKIYTPVVVFAAFLIAFVPPLLLNAGELGEWVYKALVFLVISCPCALVLSIPLGFFGGIGRASKDGILIKGSNYLEALNQVDTIVFDKTGTLTKGTFKVEKIVTANGFSKDDIVQYTAFAEAYSNHPIALSIISEYGHDVDKKLIESFEEISGMGIIVKTLDKTIVAGNEALMKKEHIIYTPSKDAGTVVYCAINGIFAGYISINDEIKEDAKNLVKQLKKAGIKKTVILSGDNKEIADYVGAQLGFDTVIANLLPEDKVFALEKIISEKKIGNKNKVMFVGDGINDAPVLARADIGVAMGLHGTDVAIESADIIITNDNLEKLLDAFRIAKKTRNVVIQNIILAFTVKAIVLILGSGGLATMWEAVFADVGVALLAVANSLRILKKGNGGKL